ncbi:MAG: hypothetical protein ACOC02_05285 [Guyparkeria sp.]
MLRVEIAVPAAVPDHHRAGTVFAFGDHPFEIGVIERIEQRADALVLYLRRLTPGAPLNIDYQLRAGIPASVEMAAARAWPYYTPEQVAASQPIQLHAN